MDNYNNGYLVKGLFKREWSSRNASYRGVGSYVSWPLDYVDDEIANRLEKEAYDKWFEFQDVLDLVPVKEYLSDMSNIVYRSILILLL
jgi:hypothetical protein